MPVFENLRNFIRHGKQAQEERNSAHAAVASAGRRSHNTPARAAGNGGESQSLQVTATRSSSLGAIRSGTASPVMVAAQELVREDQEKSRQVPRYPGLEEYELMDKMGDGAFSIVYKARHLKSNSDVAIKVVKKHGLSSSQRAAVLKEAAIMRQLKHPNIVEMRAFHETPEYYFIVLELVPGGELFHQIVRLTYFSEDLSRHVIIQVAHAIRYLHEEAGVVHRDIKPENLLFVPVPHVPSKRRVLRDSDDESKEDEGVFYSGIGGGGIGQIKLADFGLSKVIWDNKTMTPCGTVGYTAPEIVKDEKYSKNVDMWALGCVLYTILCGFPPFYDESIDVLTRKVAKGQYTFLSPWWDDISAEAKDLVTQLLTVAPDKRLTIDQFLAHPWITKNGSEPVQDLSQTQSDAQADKKASFAERRARDPAIGGVMREAFDVSNAVYRMEEDTRMAATTPYAILEEEEEEDTAELERGIAGLSVKNKTPARDREVARHAAPAPPPVFDLHLEGATLLERRRQAKKVATA